MEKRANNFDCLRFVLATAVIYSHSFHLLFGYRQGQHREPITCLTCGQGSAGDLAVNGFFTISGFLIIQSFQRSHSVWAYLQKRVARIYPGFLVCGLLCLGMVSAMRQSTLAMTPHALVRHGWLLLSLRSMEVPGAFLNAPFAGVLNGSTWTIIFEFWCYLLIVAISPLLAWRRWAAPALLALFLGLRAVTPLWSPQPFFYSLPVPWVGEWPRLISYFLAGVSAALYWRELPRQRWTIVIALLLLGAAIPTHTLWLVGPVAGSYLLLRLAYTPRLPAQRFGRCGDFSYGLYLYAWPVQQWLVASVGNGLTPVTLFIGAFGMTLPLAVGSWYWVERPFLRMKPR